MARVLIIAIAAALAACTSPESTRTRGGGPGADVGNRSAVTRMHEGAKPYERTPKLTTTEPPALDPATHADRESRR